MSNLQAAPSVGIITHQSVWVQSIEQVCASMLFTEVVGECS